MYHVIGEDYTATDLSKIPRNATIVRCDCTNITSLKGCPETVVELDVSRTQIENVNGVPKGIQKLVCNNCKKLKSISLPIGINSLQLQRTNLTKIPFLPNLKHLNVSGSKITSMPKPIGVNYLIFDYLDFSNTDITNDELATLPSSLSINLTGCNSLTSLINCPDTKTLSCTMAKNITLEGLPSTVSELYCGGTPNIKASDLPDSIKKLRIYRGNIKSLSEIPRSIVDLELGNTELKNFLGAPKNLKKFEYSGDIQNFFGLPEGLEVVKVIYGSIKTFLGLPKTVKQVFIIEADIRNSVVNCLILRDLPDFFRTDDAEKAGLVRPKATSLFRAKLELRVPVL